MAIQNLITTHTVIAHRGETAQPLFRDKMSLFTVRMIFCRRPAATVPSESFLFVMLEGGRGSGGRAGDTYDTHDVASLVSQVEGKRSWRPWSQAQRGVHHLTLLTVAHGATRPCDSAKRSFP